MQGNANNTKRVMNENKTALRILWIDFDVRLRSFPLFFVSFFVFIIDCVFDELDFDEGRCRCMISAYYYIAICAVHSFHILFFVEGTSRAFEFDSLDCPSAEVSAAVTI